VQCERQLMLEEIAVPLVGMSLDPTAGRSHVAGQPLLEALHLAIPDTAIDAAIAQTGTAELRCRLLPTRLVVALVLALGLWARDAARQVLASLIDSANERRLRSAVLRTASKGAITRARQRVGPRPLIALFRTLARPIATPETPGAFLGGLRLMAFDGSSLDLPDTPENTRIFGRPGSSRGQTAYPQLLLVWLVEVGTHIFCDALIRPCRSGEDSPVRQMLRSISPGMLVMWDSGLHSFNLVQGTLACGAHFLGRVGSNIILTPLQTLADGSYTAYIYPSPQARHRGEGGILVRVIEYTIDDPVRTGHGERHRLITSLFDLDTFPATLLAAEYHQRWEAETTADEVKVHQADRPVHVRSQRPREVIQEVYGLLVAHLAIRTLMFHAAERIALDPDRLSFINTLRIIRRAIPRFQRAEPERTPFCSPSCWTRLVKSGCHHARTVSTLEW